MSMKLTKILHVLNHKYESKEKNFCVIFVILDLPFCCRAEIQGVQLKRFTENFQRKFEKHVYMTPF